VGIVEVEEECLERITIMRKVDIEEEIEEGGTEEVEIISHAHKEEGMNPIQVVADPRFLRRCMTAQTSSPRKK
jgi:hypothetical protein